MVSILEEKIYFRLRSSNNEAIELSFSFLAEPLKPDLYGFNMMKIKFREFLIMIRSFTILVYLFFEKKMLLKAFSYLLPVFLFL
jgi:hypothetical protein